MARPISGKQCIKARHLLRWNLRDLSNRCSVNVMRIESFEKGVVRLQKPEMDYLMSTLKNQHIIFKDNFEVLLDTRNIHSDSGQRAHNSYNATPAYMNDVVHQRFSNTSD